jgi:hypothetical protein
MGQVREHRFCWSPQVVGAVGLLEGGVGSWVSLAQENSWRGRSSKYEPYSLPLSRG